MLKTINVADLFDKDLLKDDFVLLYQMMHSEESLVEASIAKAKIPSCHIHSFNDYETCLIYQNIDQPIKWYARKAYQLLLGRYCKTLQKKDYLRIISQIRDPIAVIVERFFTDLDLHGIDEHSYQPQTAQQLSQHLVSTFDKQICFDYFTHWFEREFEKNFQINILDYIDKSTDDYWRIEQSGRDILLIKYEARQNLTNVLARFLEQPKFNLVTQEAQHTHHSALQSCFINNYPFEKLFFLYQSPLYQTLYSQQEIEQFQQQWTAK